MDPEEKMNVVAIEPKCVFKRSIELPLTHHNARNEPDQDKVIDFVDEKWGDPRERKVQTVFGDSPIRCPSGVIGNRFINFSPGMVGFNAYLKGYFGRKRYK